MQYFLQLSFFLFPLFSTLQIPGQPAIREMVRPPHLHAASRKLVPAGRPAVLQQKRAAASHRRQNKQPDDHRRLPARSPHRNGQARQRQAASATREN